jgi:putative ABC transport system permease protein
VALVEAMYDRYHMLEVHLDTGGVPGRGHVRQLISDLTIATRNLSRNLRRTAVSTLTVAGGIVAFAMASGFMAWVFEDMRDSTVRSQLGHVQIVRPHYFDKGIADPYNYLLNADEKMLAKLAEIDGVVSVTPRLAFSGLASLGMRRLPSLVKVSPRKERPISARINIDQGRDLQGDNAAEVLLGEGLAANLGAKVGDRIVLLATTEQGGASAVETEVVGIFNTTTKEFDDHALRLPIERARHLMRVSGATSWVMLLDSHTLTQPMIRQLQGFMATDLYEFVPWTSLADFTTRPSPFSVVRFRSSRSSSG